MFSSPQPSLSRASKPLWILCCTAAPDHSNRSVLHSLLWPATLTAGAWALNGSLTLALCCHFSLLFSNVLWSSCLGLSIVVLQHHFLKPQLGGMGKGLTDGYEEGLGPPGWSQYLLYVQSQARWYTCPPAPWFFLLGPLSHWPQWWCVWYGINNIKSSFPFFSVTRTQQCRLLAVSGFHCLSLQTSMSKGKKMYIRIIKMRLNYLKVNQHKIATSLKRYMKFYWSREQADATASFGSRLEFFSKSALKEIYYIFNGHGGEK